MRICHLGKYYPPAPGGIETLVRTLALAQRDLGHEVRVVAARHERGRTRTTTEDDGGVAVHRLGRAASFAKLDVCPDAVGLIRELDRSGAVDVFHVQTPNPLMVLALWAARPRTPWVVTHQSDVLKQRARALALAPFERFVYDGAAAILPTSPTYVPGSPALRSREGKLRVLPNGVDLGPYLRPSEGDRAKAARLRAELAADGGPLWVGCGRLIYYKGFETGIRALRHCPGRLAIVGDGPERGRLEREAERAGVRDRVTFAGGMPYPEVIPYYLAATAFWFPSRARTEAFGIAQVEAMACGLPVVNTAIPNSGVAWVSRDGETGFTAPVDDAEAFGAAARRLAEAPELARRLGEAARARAERWFGHRAMAERSLEIYGEALGVGAPVSVAASERGASAGSAGAGSLAGAS